MPRPALPLAAIPAPSTPLGPFADSAVAWTTWVTLMGSVGLAAFALVCAGPVARRIGGSGGVDLARATRRLTVPAAVLALLVVPASLTDIAHDASESGGYDYSAAWNALFDATNDGRLAGLEVTFSLVAAALLAPLAVRRVAESRARTWLLGAGLAAGLVALGTTKFPDEKPEVWSRTVFETAMWMCHLVGGAVWLGGLAGLVILAVPGVVGAQGRGAFWSPVIRRFSVAAMACVGAIALSGLWLYWEHVDGLSQLVHTMYGRVLGVKILIFGALLVLGAVNQFWLHPRIDALRAAGDDRPLRTVLLRRFPAVVAVETLFVLLVLFVAPFLHGSARTQAFQAEQAKHVSSADQLTKLPPKTVGTSTWVWGTAETLLVVAVMVGGYRASGRIARARQVSAAQMS